MMPTYVFWALQILSAGSHCIHNNKYCLVATQSHAVYPHTPLHLQISKEALYFTNCTYKLKEEI